MKKLSGVILFIGLILASCSKYGDPIIFDASTASLRITINDKGSIVNLIDVKTGKDYLLKDTLSSLMSVRIDNQIKHPESATAKDGQLTLAFENDILADIKVDEKETHVTFELIAITNKEAVELIIWGPYANMIDEIIGETIGVVRGEGFTLGIQALNIKTMGGYPWNESDRMPAFDFVRNEDPDDMHPDSDGSVLYRVEAAKPLVSGSSLQAYCRNRDKERIYQDVNHENIVAPPYEDGGVIGSKIALFGCDLESTLETIGKIELAEGLPHPMIDGEWVKTHKEAAAAYLITSYTEANVDQAIALTKKAGLKYLYHYGKTFESWGHFDLYDKEFPNGIQGLKACVEKAEAQGIKMGTHCLSNFITTNDPYVSPVPDKRLAKVGSSVITENMDASITEVTIQSPDFFNQMKNNNLKTVMIGEELIRYGSVSEKSPWKLLDCQRGAFNTVAASHESGAEISKLLDHGYKVFLTNADLTIEMSETLASLYNETGLRQISFDGLEGNRSTGLGTYGETLMPYTWYNSLSEELKKHLIIDASRTTHFFWHIYTRMNWGEPWYAGFRESQTEYRFNNQAYFKRNFMPGMLGWFRMDSITSIEDIEWLLARSAGYDAGYALVADLGTVEKNGNSNEILELIGDWEKLRISNSFTEEQKEAMRDNSMEFSIERVADDVWNLQEINAEIFTHEKKVRQPGEPLFSTFEFVNMGNEQVLNFVFTAKNCDVNDIVLEINNYKKIQIPLSMKEDQILKYEGGDQVILYNSSWQVISKYKIDPTDFSVKNGDNTISIDCDFLRAAKEANLKVEVRTSGKKEEVNLRS